MIMLQEDDFDAKIGALEVESLEMFENTEVSTRSTPRIRSNGEFGRRRLGRQASYFTRVTTMVLPTLSNFLEGVQQKNDEDPMQEMVKKRVISMNDVIASLKLKRVRKAKLLACVVYIVFVLAYFFICLSQRQVGNSFRLEHALAANLRSIRDEHHTDSKSTHTSSDSDGRVFSDITSMEHMFTWIRQALLPTMFNPDPRWYSGKAKTKAESFYFMDYNRILGGLKVSQRRVDPCNCTQVDDYSWADSLPAGMNRESVLRSHPHPKDIFSWNCSRSRHYCRDLCSDRFSEFYPILYPPYSTRTLSKFAFGPYFDPARYEWERDNYGGGHHIYTNDDSELINKFFEELVDDLFTSRGSRQLVLTFVVYNGNYQLFTSVSIKFSFYPTGLLEKSMRLDTFPLEPYLRLEDRVRVGIELLFVIFVLVNIWELAQDLRFAYREGELRKKLREFWVYIDTIRIGLFITCIVQWLLIVTDPIATTLVLPLPHDAPYMDLDPLLFKYRLYTLVNSICVIVCLLGCFKYFHYSPKYGILVRTISKAIPDLIQFFYMFVIVFIVFSVMGMMIFGHVLSEWSSFFSAWITLTMMLTVEYGMQSLVEVDAYQGTMFYFLFLVLVYFLLVNILLAILIDAYTDLCNENKLSKEEEKDTLKIDIFKELMLEKWFRAYTFIKKRIGMPTSEASFLTIEDYLQMLDSDTLRSQALMRPVKRTVSCPNPEPELLLTFNILTRHFSQKHSLMLMAAFGRDSEDLLQFAHNAAGESCSRAFAKQEELEEEGDGDLLGTLTPKSTIGLLDAEDRTQHKDEQISNKIISLFSSKSYSPFRKSVSRQLSTRSIDANEDSDDEDEHFGLLRKFSSVTEMSGSSRRKESDASTSSRKASLEKWRKKFDLERDFSYLVDSVPVKEAVEPGEGTHDVQMQEEKSLLDEDLLDTLLEEVVAKKLEELKSSLKASLMEALKSRVAARRPAARSSC